MVPTFTVAQGDRHFHINVNLTPDISTAQHYFRLCGGSWWEGGSQKRWKWRVCVCLCVCMHPGCIYIEPVSIKITMLVMFTHTQWTSTHPSILLTFTYSAHHSLMRWCLGVNYSLQPFKLESSCFVPVGGLWSAQREPSQLRWGLTPYRKGLNWNPKSSCWGPILLPSTSHVYIQQWNNKNGEM